MTVDTRPIYLKLRDIVAAGIIDGTYPEGSLLPSVRAFASAQGANPLTVAKAYQQFQLDGLVDAQRGIGLVVTEGASERLRAMERATFLESEWPAVRSRIEMLGLTAEDLLTPTKMAK